MKTISYIKFLLLSVLLLSFTACESEEETEYNLPGTWYTNEEIDFDAYAWGRGTLMTFNARHQGTIGSKGDPDYLIFSWDWIDEGYNTMELIFGDESAAYIWGAEASSNTFSGTWFNNWRDYKERVNGQPFYMHRQ